MNNNNKTTLHPSFTPENVRLKSRMSFLPAQKVQKEVHPRCAASSDYLNVDFSAIHLPARAAMTCYYTLFIINSNSAV